MPWKTWKERTQTPESGRAERVKNQYEAFQNRHFALQNESDAGLVACYRFLQWWKPEYFDALGWPDEMKGANVVFRLEGEHNFIHDREAARQLWTSQMNQDHESGQAVCLVTGELSPIARLHPSIKGVRGAQSAGASIVSFNLDAFESYGHKQGDNAPVSEDAAAAYTTVLNHFLRTDENKVQLGDASTVFWADGSEAAQCEALFSFLTNDTDGRDKRAGHQVHSRKNGKGPSYGENRFAPRCALLCAGIWPPMQRVFRSASGWKATLRRLQSVFSGTI